MRISVITFVAIILALFIISCSSPENEPYLSLSETKISLLNIKENSEIFVLFEDELKKYNNPRSYFELSTNKKIISILLYSDNLYILRPKTKIDITEITNKIDIFLNNYSTDYMIINNIQINKIDFNSIYFNEDFSLEVALKNEEKFKYNIDKSVKFLHIPKKNQKELIKSHLNYETEINIDFLKDYPFDLYNYKLSKKIKELNSEDDLINILTLLKNPISSISENNIYWNPIDEDNFLQLLK